MKNTLSTFLLSVALLTSIQPVSAQAVNKAYVFSEDDTADHSSCGATYDRAVANVESALRFNRFEIAGRDELGLLNVYINLNVMKLSTGCIAQFSLEFRTYGAVKDPISGQIIFAKISYCDKGTLISGDPSYLRTNLNSELTAFTNLCVKEFLGRHRSTKS